MAKAKRGFTFQSMEIKKPNYSKFNLSHDTLRAIPAGYAIPLWWTECIPGDTWKINLSSFVRLLALSSPMMQREDIFIRAFKVPLRILVNQEDLDIAYAGDKNGNHIDFPFVTCDTELMTIGSLYDYLDLPLPYDFNSSTGEWFKMRDADIDAPPQVSALPFLAYQRIIHDHFRNEETRDEYLDEFKQRFEMFIDDDEPIPAHSQLVDGGEYLDKLQKVCWERDYLTSALSSPQRGSQVMIPLVGSAPVVPSSSEKPELNYTTPGAQSNLELYRSPTGSLQPSSNSNAPMSWRKSGLIVDGAEFSGIGAVALRLAMNLQAFMERNNIAGYRMIGNVLAHFGVMSSNRLMDEAEYLGGIKAPITISAVNQTSATESGGTPQGTQTGIGQSAFTDHLCRTFCEEPAILMVIGYINAKSGYCQGLARKWTRKNYLDYYWPEFQTVGEQEILNQEVFYNFINGITSNSYTWAYQSRYAEYKYEPDSVCGEFRTSLSYWHQKRLFTSLPAFNNNFVLSNPSDRVFALDSSTYPRPYLGEFWFDVQVIRPMDKYAQSKLW